MAIVIWFDRGTGQILKVDDHPDWPSREVFLNWYHEHSEEVVKGAGMLTVPENVAWDGNPADWLVRIDSRGNPQLVRREEAEADQEIERAKELAILEMAMRHINHYGAKIKLQKRINELKGGKNAA